MEFQELEELFKSVNRNAIKAFLRNAAILKDTKASSEMKELAAANVKAILNNQPVPKAKTAPKSKKQKINTESQQPTQSAQQTSQPTTIIKPLPSSKVQPSPKMEFHEEFARHHGINPLKFKAAYDAMSPEQQKMTQVWHAEQLTAPKIKVAKSIDSLYNLFIELKKHL